MRRQAKQNNDNARAAIANEAARIIQEQGLTDFRAAKDKARDRLGYLATGSLPSNEEIERALAERNRIFLGDQHLQQLRRMRNSAAAAMRLLDQFQPRLAGSVLTGNATGHSAIELHLFSDPAELVNDHMDAIGIVHRSTQFGHRFRRDTLERFPGVRFTVEDAEFRATVFPELRIRRAPLSPVDGKPMERANVTELERLLSTSAS